jgi:tRNA pseudouridine13 synthase
MYWTKSPGINGELLSEEDFIVEEIPLRKFFLRYARSAGGVSLMTGKYFLYKLRKRGLTTKDAIRAITKRFRLVAGDIGYAGLKDKHAVTMQYLTIRKDVGNFSGNIELTRIGTTNSFMQIGELEGNKFTIILHGCSVKNTAVIGELKKRGLPNYFGKQRFGLNNNQEIGKLLVKRKYSEASGRIGKSLDSIDRKELKFFIHAYQSFLFNRLLDDYVKLQKSFSGELPILGSETKKIDNMLKKIMEEEGITPKDFEFRDLRIKCTGSMRPAFVSVKNLNYKIEGDNIMLEFTLPPGSYATIVLREVTKNGRF